AVFAIRLLLLWRRAPCAQQAANSAGNLFAESWEEFSPAVRGEGSTGCQPVGQAGVSPACLPKSSGKMPDGPSARMAVLQQKSPDAFCTSGDLSRSFISLA